MQLFYHLSDYTIFSLILTAACFFQGVFGFGFVLIAMPLLVALGFQDKSVIAVFVCLSLYINAISLFTYRKNFFEGVQIKRLLIGAVIGMPPAYFMLTLLKLQHFFWSVGILVFSLGLLQIFRVKLPGYRNKGFEIFTGFTVSMIQTLFAMSGPVLAFLLKQNDKSPLQLKIKMLTFNLLINILSIVVFLKASLISYTTVQSVIYLLPPATLGLCGGFLIFKKIKLNDFSKLLSYFMMMLGSLMFFKGFL